MKIIDTLKSGTAPSRLLDCDIHLAFVGNPQYGSIGPWRNPTPGTLEGYVAAFRDVIDADDHIPDEVVPRYTASMDAAVKLIPPGMFWTLGCGRTRPDEPLAGASIVKPDDLVNPVGEAEGDHLALCICIAALEARLSLQPST